MMESRTTNGHARRRPVSFPVVIGLVVVAILAIAGGVWLGYHELWAGSADSEAAAPADLDAAVAAYNSGDFAGAEETLEQLVASSPDNLEARRSLALALSAQGKNEEALEQYAAIIERDPQDHASLYRMAAIEQLIGQATESITHLEQAIAVEEDPVYLQSLAPIYGTVGKWTETIATWERYLETAELDEKRQAQVHAAIASAYEGMRDYDNARESLEKAIFLDPGNEVYQARLEGYGD